MGLYDDLNAAGLLAIGLIPEWVDQDGAVADWTGAPSNAAAGVYLQGSPKALAQVNARESVHRREARTEVTTFDLTTTVYTVIVNGNSVVFDAAVETPASNVALIVDLAAKVSADGTVGLLVTAVADPDDPTKMLVTGKAEADFSYDCTAVGGAGVVVNTAAATGFDVRVFTTPGGIVKSGNTGKPGGWVLPVDATYTGRTWRGFAERFDVAGIDRAYVEVYNLTKHAADGASLTATLSKVMIGPAVLEATS